MSPALLEEDETEAKVPLRKIKYTEKELGDSIRSHLETSSMIEFDQN